MECLVLPTDLLRQMILAGALNLRASGGVLQRGRRSPLEMRFEIAPIRFGLLVAVYVRFFSAPRLPSHIRVVAFRSTQCDPKGAARTMQSP